VREASVIGLTNHFHHGKNDAYFINLHFMEISLK